MTGVSSLVSEIPDDARHRWSVLADQIQGHLFAYYVLDAPTVSDGEFDLCLCFNGLHCLPDPAAAVREIARCLASGGRLIGDTVVRGAGLRQAMIIGAFRRAGLFGSGGTADDLHHWLTDARLRVDRLTTSPLTPGAAGWPA